MDEKDEQLEKVENISGELPRGFIQEDARLPITCSRAWVQRIPTVTGIGIQVYLSLLAVWQRSESEGERLRVMVERRNDVTSGHDGREGAEKSEL
jgi:hypothetical protein